MRSALTVIARRILAAAMVLGISGSFVTAQAADTPILSSGTIDTGSTAWVLVAAALVLFMTLPGLALFYGGLVRARNLLSVLIHCFAIVSIVSVIWAAFGYSLAFDGNGPFIGTVNHLFLADTAGKILPNHLPEGAFILFQMTFAVITPALIIGAFVERVRFSFVALFSAAWLILVYLPVTHWVWGGGWLAARGTIDFAGGIVVHTTAGIAALVAAMVIGPRDGFPHRLNPPHSPGMTMAGAGMLWFGWFGFNGGSALAADGSAANAILATHFAASAAALVWMAIEWLRIGKPTSIGFVTGVVAGLATVTPASGYVGPAGAMAIGAIGSAICFYATLFIKQGLKIDDSLDVFAVHGVGGITGSILVAFFAAPVLGGVGYAEGMDWVKQLTAQGTGVLAAGLWSGVCTFGLIKLLDILGGVRVSVEEESDGLDLATHGERAYDHT